MRGLLLASRLTTAILPGLSELPISISLFGDSQCTISTMECDHRLLDTWFGNRVAEVLEHIETWRRMGILVNSLEHWPGDTNIADLTTKGRATLQDVDKASEWQLGPKAARFPRETWPTNTTFKRSVPVEELRSKVHQAYSCISSTKSNYLPILLSLVREVMGRSNKLVKIYGILARHLQASISRNREDI